MANPQRGEVAFEIDGTTYTLALGFNAMCEVEEMVSTPARRVTFKHVAEGIVDGDVRYLRAFVWGALRRHHPEVGVKEVDALVDAAGGYLAFLPRFTPVLTRLLDYTKPDERDRGVLKEGNGRPPADPATTGGTISTRSISRRAKSA